MQACQAPLTDSQWQYIEKLVDNGRKRKTSLRRVVDALHLMGRTGSQWRNMDSQYRDNLPVIRYYFYKWRSSGILDKIMSY